MSDYTPTNEQVRSSYSISDKDKVTYPSLAWGRIITTEAFSRWLTAHDAEIRTAALEEAAVITGDFWDHFVMPNLHRQASQIAATIRAAKEKRR